MTFESSVRSDEHAEAPLFSIADADQDQAGFSKLNANGIFAFDSKDIRSRPFTLLRAQVLKIAQSRGWRIIGVTSPTPRVGKSFVISNLAASMSRMPELHTYLFDLDLRRSSIAHNFNLDGEYGVADFLDGTIPDLRSVARRIGDQNLTVLPSYPNRSASDELLASARMDLMIKAMRSLPENTICLVDLPPVFANDDAVIVAQKIDAYLLVIEDGSTTRKQVRDSFRLLSPAPCIGTVLNRYDGGIASDDYGYGYGESGKYSEYYSRRD